MGFQSFAGLSPSSQGNRGMGLPLISDASIFGNLRGLSGRSALSAAGVALAAGLQASRVSSVYGLILNTSAPG